MPALIVIFCWFAFMSPAARAAQAPSRGILVFAAASLTNVFEDIGARYKKASATSVTFSFAATSILARQLEAGARADVFVSADPQWMDYLQSRHLIDRQTRRDLLGNRLVLITPADSTMRLQIAPHFPLAAALGENGRIATGDPDSAPVGRYARSALTSLRVWADVADRLVRADNVRIALNFVARGEAPLGIVYQTDAFMDPRVRVVDTFPENTHPPINYPVALTHAADPTAAQFLKFLQSPEALAVFRKYGFLEISQ